MHHVSDFLPICRYCIIFDILGCKTCKEMKHEYYTTSVALKQESFPGWLMAVDCSLNPLITNKYEIYGFPTFKLFLNGKFVADYKGKCNTPDIKKFVTHNKNLKYKEL